MQEPQPLRAQVPDGWYRCQLTGALYLPAPSLHRSELQFACFGVFHSQELAEVDGTLMAPCGHEFRPHGRLQPVAEQFVQRCARLPELDRWRNRIVSYLRALVESGVDPDELRERFAPEVLRAGGWRITSGQSAAFAGLWLRSGPEPAARFVLDNLEHVIAQWTDYREAA